MKVIKFVGHEQAQAKVEKYDNGEMRLISYVTCVAYVDTESCVHVRGLYSRTTIKHLSWFAKMLGTSYQQLKALYMDDKKMNIYTGEIFPE